MTMTPADATQRQRCLDGRRSFSVRAPAGSGKTELLTQRVLVLLSGVRKPEEILCITFTRKAAAEMLDRILQTLRWADSAPEPESGYKRQAWQLARRALEQNRQQGWQLLENPSRLRILTIDGLCARLTKSLPALSGFGSQPDILPDPWPVYQQAVQRLLAELDSEDEIAHALEKLLTHLDNQLETAERLLISMLARRDQWLGLVGSGAAVGGARPLLEQALDRLLREELNEIRDLLTQAESELASLADYAAANLQQSDPDSSLTACLGMVELPGSGADQLSRWRALSELCLTDKGDWRRSITVRQGFPAGTGKAEKEQAKARKSALKSLLADLKDIPGLRDRLYRLRMLPGNRYSDAQWALLEALTVLLPNLAAHLLICFTEQGAVDYPQITAAALRALGDEEEATDLSLILDYQIRHILVDEFQDTATPQIQLLEKLTRGWEPGDGRTLFIVGDGMQSCYGFRDANVGLFLDARKHGIGDVDLEAADLCVNFRSQQGVVDWVNRVFQEAFPERDDISRGAVSYEQSVAFNPALSGEAVSVECFAGFGDRRAEALRTVELVQEAFARNPQGSVAILVRNRPHLREILPALREAGLRWQATDLDSLSSRMWVIDLVSLLRALINPADRIAWLALLRAPWVGLDNSDLLAVAGAEGKHLCLWTRLQNSQELPLSAEGGVRVSRLVQVLEHSLEQKQRKPLRIWLEGTWLALGGPASLSSASQLDDIQRVFALLAEHDRGAQLDSYELFIRDLERLFVAPDSDADPRLQVMTIHKSKGLEFDTVIIAGLDRSPRVEEKQLLLWQQRLTDSGRQDLLLGPLAATGDDEDPLYQYLRQEQALKNQMEGTRLLYVGTTRAVQKLHLLAHLSISSRSGEPAAPSGRSLLGAIWEQVSEQAVITSADSDTGSQPHRVLRRIMRLPAGFEVQVSGNDNLLRLREDAEFTSDDGENRPQINWQELPRHIGTLTHRILRQLVLHPEHYRNRDSLVDYHPAWQRQLEQLGVSAGQCVEAATAVDQLIRNTLADPTGRWILDPDHRDSACELPVSFFNGFQTRQLIIDRTFIDERGCRWIIDYKTAAIPDGEEQATFLAAEALRYQKQLAGYCNAFRKLGSEPVRAALYFPQFSYFHELTGI